MSSSEFPLELLKGEPIHIVGGGSLGGQLLHMFFRKRVPELHMWDFDVVRLQNLYNQLFENQDVNEQNPILKVDAHARILRNINPRSETKLVFHSEPVMPTTKLKGIVACAVDWNRIRYEEVWPAVAKNPDVVFFADGRVGMDGGKAFGVDPNNVYHEHCYTNPPHNHPDPANAEADAACKSDYPMPENAAAVASEVMWRITRWLHLLNGCSDPYDNFVGWMYKPQRAMMIEQWDAGVVRQMEGKFV